MEEQYTSSRNEIQVARGRDSDPAAGLPDLKVLLDRVRRHDLVAQLPQGIRFIIEGYTA